MPGCYSGVETQSHAADTDPGVDTDPADDDSGDGDSSGGEPLEPDAGGCDPGDLADSTLRRLNRREYRNTVQDLFGLPQIPQVALPWDDLNAQGFDNDGSSLALDVAAAEQYFDAAVAVATNLDGAGTPPLGQCAAFSGEDLHSCLDPALQGWLERAFRRPVSESTLDVLRPLLADVTSYAEARDVLVTFTLTSPNFLYHYKPNGNAEAGPDGYLIADRLAYLVWSSTPDATLLDAAASGALLDEARLEAEVDRMLADPRSGRFFQDFSAQWLKLGVLDQKPDAELHGALLDDMRTETQAFFELLARENLPLSSLIDHEQAYVNGRLADHYGIDTDLDDETWAWVDLPPERRGLLMQGALLVASSGDTFSDPIRRGAWIAEQIVCQEPAPPPFEPPELPTPDAGDATTVRELLEQHRNDPACASCHALMDPYGLAMETFDRLGLHRDAYDNGRLVDGSGVLPTGETFDDALGLVALMSERPEFEACSATFLAAYAVGRALEDEEHCFTERVVEAARARDEAFGFRDLLVALSSSYMFVNTGAQ
jgi:hypothetical protein